MLDRKTTHCLERSVDKEYGLVYNFLGWKEKRPTTKLSLSETTNTICGSLEKGPWRNKKKVQRKMTKRLKDNLLDGKEKRAIAKLSRKTNTNQKALMLDKDKA